MPTSITALTFAAAVASGAVGGVFFAFSAFVMAGLDRLPPGQAVAAMQEINVTAPRAPLMLLLFGTAVACVALAVYGVAHLGDRRGVLLCVGAVVYVAGTVIVTGVGNVPLNDTIAAVDPAGTGAAAEWSRFMDGWLAWNHVRTVAGLAAAAAFAWALVS